ncbi:RNA polymerase sigma factor [Chitinophaga defluvii]|uniref:Sigma-70 family RNA polymerase sigma factor n=1 Tax=Chitinophaga defluvii TaxID=3163343 RepID=A0ABV2T9R6_9BACT
MSISPIHNESILLARVAHGDEKAFTELFHAYHHQLGEFVMLLTASNEMTAEIVQDVFLKVWMNRQELATVDKFTAYLFILTRNYTLNCLRKLANDRKKQVQYGQYVTTTAATEPQPVNTDYFTLVDSAIAQLPPQQQQVYLLSRRDGLKHVEIATQMGISRETVKKYIQLAVKSVGDFIKKAGKSSLTGLFLLFL